MGPPSKDKLPKVHISETVTKHYRVLACNCSPVVVVKLLKWLFLIYVLHLHAELLRRICIGRDNVIWKA